MYSILLLNRFLNSLEFDTLADSVFSEPTSRPSSLTSIILKTALGKVMGNDQYLFFQNYFSKNSFLFWTLKFYSLSLIRDIFSTPSFKSSMWLLIARSLFWVFWLSKRTFVAWRKYSSLGMYFRWWMNRHSDPDLHLPKNLWKKHIFRVWFTAFVGSDQLLDEGITSSIFDRN